MDILSLLRAASRQPVCLLLVAACLLPGGCAMRHTVAQTESGAPQYRNVRLVYRLSQTSSRGTASFSRTAPGLVDLGSSANEGLADEVADWQSARLEILYPHPAGTEGMVRAVLQLSHDASIEEPELNPRPVRGRLRQAAAILPFVEPRDPEAVDTPEGFESVRILDIPKEQLDLLLVDLAGSGLFEEQQQRPDGGTTFDVTVDRGRTRKAWTPEPRLDDLVMRVWRDGRPIHGGPSAPGSRTSSRNAAPPSTVTGPGR